MPQGTARIAVWEGGALWLLDAPEGFGEPDTHAHHALQITFRLAGRLTLEGAAGPVTAAAIGVAPDAPHRLDARGRLAILFLEPESRDGRAALALLGGRPVAALEGRSLETAAEALGEAFDRNLSMEALRGLGRTLVQALVPSEEAPLPDPRVRTAIDALAGRLDEPPALPQAAAAVALSPGRLRHLFAEETGLPYKTYLLWLRLHRAVALYGAGHSLTEAAHEAGFADSAHFSRTFRRTFGQAATSLRRT